jgi:hypothetical protein
MSFRRFLGLGLLGVMLATPLLYSAPQAGGQRKNGKRKGGGRKKGPARKRGGGNGA